MEPRNELDKTKLQPFGYSIQYTLEVSVIGKIGIDPVFVRQKFVIS